jgi:hypothetical protein
MQRWADGEVKEDIRMQGLRKERLRKMSRKLEDGSRSHEARTHARYIVAQM